MSLNRTGLTWHHIKDPARHSRTLGQQRHGGSRERGLAGRLHHNRAAGSKGGTGLAGDHRRREVPGRDGPDHSDRRLGDHNPLVGVGRGNRLAINAPRLLCEPAQEACRIGNFTSGFLERFALFQGHDLRQLLLVLVHQVVPLHEDVGTLKGGQRTPSGEGILGGGDSTLGLAPTQARHLANHLTRGRIEHLDLLAAVSSDPTAIDIGKGTKQRVVLQIFHGNSPSCEAAG